MDDVVIEAEQDADHAAVGDVVRRRAACAPEHRVSIDLPNWAREGAQVYLLSGYDPRIRGRVEYPPEIAAVTE